VNKEEILRKIQLIFRDVFDDDNLMITRQTNSSQIEEWDSLNHINLTVAIEKEFNIRFALNELQPLKDVGEMIDLLQKKLFNT
jgi:acyl carrier protein